MSNQNYNLSGYYVYQNSKSQLTGILKLSDLDTFETEITDHTSVNSRQIIMGGIKKFDNKIVLAFYKYPTQSNLINLLYVLEKPKKDKHDDFGGSYVGQWKTLLGERRL